jgi:anti-sigma regulatory factor (Ser/Thr protein kinase)
MSTSEREDKRDAIVRKLSGDAQLLDLQMQARYFRDRHRLHVERPTARPTSPEKLEKMRLARERAEARLRRAEERRAREVEIDIERHLPQESASIGEARRALNLLEPVVDRETLDTLRLLVSELVTNSVRHGRAESPEAIELSVRASRDRIRVEVADMGPGFEAAPRAEAHDQGSGWGLHLVETMSDRWGAERNGDMRVWFELVDSDVSASQRVRRVTRGAAIR